MFLSAQTYKHSLGVIVGSLDGISYKTFIDENVAFQGDLTFGFISTVGTINGVGRYGDIMLDIIDYRGPRWSFVANPNLYYQKDIYNASWGDFNVLMGAGLSLGLVQESALIWTFGKCGANAILGFEFDFNNTPFTFGFDFRPGYFMMFGHDLIGHFFDWGVALNFRYTF